MIFLSPQDNFGAPQAIDSECLAVLQYYLAYL